MSENLETTTATTDGAEQTEETVTMTREELDALLQKTGDARVSQALKTQERKSQEKIREAQRVAAMTAEEKYKYELDQREAAIAAKEKELVMAENRNECSKILADKGLSLDLVRFCVAETAEEMTDNIKILEKAFKSSVKAEVEKRLGSKTPKKDIGGYDGMTKEQFSKLSLAEMQRMSIENPEIYNSFTK